MMEHVPVKRIRARLAEERCAVDGDFWPCRATILAADQAKRDARVEQDRRFRQMTGRIFRDGLFIGFFFGVMLMVVLIQVGAIK